jgi:hypothetical protein
MSARHRNPSGELTTSPVEPVRSGRTRRAPRLEAGASRGAATPPAQRRRGTGPQGIALSRGDRRSGGVTDPHGTGTSSGTVTYRGATDPRGTDTSPGATDPRGATLLGGATLPRGIGASRGGAPRPPTPNTRSPLMLRATLATALLAAVGISMMRAHVDFGAVAGDALRLTPAAHGSNAANQQVVHLVPAGSQPAQIASPNNAAKSGPKTSPSAAAAAAAGSVSGTTAGRKATTPKARPGARCQVKYVLTPQPDGRSSVVVTVNNLGASSIDGWVVRWPAPANQELALGWGAGLAHAGADAIATDDGFNKLIPVNGRVSFGFSGWNLATTPSTAFTVNGVMCK